MDTRTCTRICLMDDQSDEKRVACHSKDVTISFFHMSLSVVLKDGVREYYFAKIDCLA